MRVLFISCLVLLIATTTFAESYPLAPDELMTPGSLCNKPDAFRYSEQISYCNRDVSPAKKRFVMQKYMEQFPDLIINEENRGEYKIDHYIPLCMGGSNDVTNLWPQHESIYHYTDEIELDLCTELQDGLIVQVDAIAMMKFAKNHLDELRESEDPMQFIEDNYNK